jgi:anti-sigma factor RsiW
MSHQPFETWNLDRENLPPELQVELDRHVAGCPVCQQNRLAWERACRDLQSAQRLAAPPGFATRFQNCLAEHRERQRRRQSQQILLVLGLTFVAVFSGFLGLTFAATPPAEWLASTVQGILNLSSTLQEFLYIIPFWVSRVPTLVLLAAGLVPTMWLLVILITAVLAFTQLHPQGGKVR